MFFRYTASNENRDIIYDVVEKTSKKCFVPLTVGGGVRSVEDINKDGMKQSPNFEDTSKIAAKSNCPVIISGGVSSIDDIKKAKGLKNIEGIIVGKAIYDGDIDLKELVKEDA